MSQAAIALGTSGLILESAGYLSTALGEFARLMKSLAAVADAVGRTMAQVTTP